MKKNAWMIGTLVILGFALYIFSRANYLLFHLAVESLTIYTGMLIFTLSVISKKFNQSSFIITLGPGILVASLITFLHAATYEGMNIIHSYDANLPTQFWILLNYILSVSILIAILFDNKKIKFIWNIIIFSCIGLLGMLLCFTGLFPTCFVEGEGLTVFKKVSEYIIILIYLVCLILIYRKKITLDKKTYTITSLFLSFFILGEFMLTLYSDVYGIQNFLGHYFRAVAFLIIYIFIVAASLQNHLKKILENKKKLNNTNQVMEEILEATHVGIWEWNVQTGETIFNERWAEIIGYTLDEISPTSIETWIRFTHPDDIKKSDEQLERIFSNVQEYYEIECRIKHKDGSWIWINDRGKVVTWTNDGKPLTMRGTHSDITKSKREEEKNIYLGYHDFLTGVYNRRFYEEELRRLDTERNLPLTIAMGDLNGLKLINDSFGHHMGDEFLKKVAELIKETCRADDIVSRVGGDEFVIILPKTDGLEAGEIINRIYKSVSEKRVENLKFSISFGYETKTEMGQKIEDVFKGAEDHMYRHKLYESNSIKSQMIDLIMNTLHEKNPRESLHSKRVSEICESIAKGMGLDNENINKIRVAGLMHDIGKIGIDEKALNSVGKLNDEEWKEIKKHPEISYRILGSAKEFSEIAMFALDHHERWDGSGYPNRLREKEISLPARIIAVADAFDAMIGERSYRESISEEDAMKEIIKCSGTQFDPYIVEIFVKQSLKEL